MLVFVHIEKTAGTSLKFIFRNTFGRRHCDSLKNKKPIFTQADLDYAKSIFGQIKCLSGHNLVEPTRHLTEEGLHFLTILREPIVRSASFYQDHCLRGGYAISFEDWMRDPRRHNMQTRRIAGSEDVAKAKRLLAERYAFVGLTERFDESLRLLSVVCPEPLNLKFKRELIAPDNRIKQRLLQTPETRQLLQAANEKDSELHRYVQKELFPQRLRAYREAMTRVELPQSHYHSRTTLTYRSSVIFNRWVYRQLLKLNPR
jgi:hypothetical protein